MMAQEETYLEKLCRCKDFLFLLHFDDYQLLEKKRKEKKNERKEQQGGNAYHISERFNSFIKLSIQFLNVSKFYNLLMVPFSGRCGFRM